MNVYEFLEWTWVLSSLIGVAVLAYLARDALLDRHVAAAAVAAALNGRRGIYASMYLRHVCVFLFIQSINLVVGTAAVLSPDPLDPHNIRMVSALAADALNLAMDVVVILDVYDRRAIAKWKPRPTDA